MSRRCMRPGCDRPAVARFTFDPVGCELWVDALANHSAPVQELCTFHVDRLTVPRGWTVIDRRPGVVASEAVASEAVASEAVASEAVASEAVASEAVASEPEPGEPEAPAAERRERPPGKPGSPLLERAFAWTGPQHSILTQPRRDDDAD